VFAEDLFVNQFEWRILDIECGDVEQWDAKLFRGNFGYRSTVEFLATDKMRDQRKLLGVGFGLQAFGVSNGQKALAHKS
jgi:hypothetical protein